MARMIPDRLAQDVPSQAERRLYTEFARQLPDDWTVFHQVRWQSRDPKRGAKDGEIDFVLTHPEYGIIALEVKGGQVSRNGQTGQWYSTGGVSIQDPFQQVTRNKYNLLNLLKEHSYWQNRWVKLGHAVAFPDVAVSLTQIGLDAPRAIVLDSTDLTNLTEWLKQVVCHWQGEELVTSRPSQQSIGPDGINALVALLSPSVTFRPLLATEIEEEAKVLLSLTEQQYNVLNGLRKHRRAAINGCAGSGKTMLAVEKARRLSQAGFKVLLTCFNEYLGDHLQVGLADEPNIKVAHFHKLCYELAKQAGLSTSGTVTDQEYFNETLPDLALSAADQLGWKVDAVIVDEGQDFHENWWLTLQCLLREPDNGIFYVFYDDNQRVHSNQLTLPSDLLQYSLSENCRNTGAIHHYVSQYYRSDDVLPTSRAPQGREVRMLTYNDPASLKKLLKAELNRLVHQEQIPIEDIVVLTPYSEDKSALWQLGLLGNFRLTDQPFQATDVACYTIRRFKGLESPIVILTELLAEPSPVRLLEQETLLYVGASRACHHLIILQGASTI